MDHTCPTCGTQVAPEARACPRCGLAHNVPVFDAHGTFLGSSFAGSGGTPRPSPTLSTTSSPPVSPRPRRRFLGPVIAVFVVAILLGVGVAYGIRVGTGTLAGTASRGPTPGPAVPPVSPDPPETPDRPTTGPFAEVSRAAESGTHRVLATTCTGTGVATAFQFGTEGLLVTSAHAVSGARSIAVLSGDRVLPATVAKIDGRSGLALLKPDAELTGRTFELGTRQLAVGDEVAVAGWTTESQQPTRGRLRVAVGTISEAGLEVTSPEGRHPGVRRLSGEFDVGLAGAPVLGEDGRVLGTVLQATEDQNELLVTGLDTIADPLLGPTGMPPMMEPCLTAAGPEIVTAVGGTAPTATRTQLGQWFGALNAGDWDRARGALTGQLKEDWTREKLTAAYQGSFSFGLAAEPAEGSGTRVSWVQLNPEGPPCERHAARVMVDQTGIASLTPEGPPVPCG